MADLQCTVRNPGCLKTALFVCHHCGHPICSHCDRTIIDRQFAKSAQSKKYPKTHHCPSCYQTHRITRFLKKPDILWLQRLLRQIFFLKFIVK